MSHPAIASSSRHTLPTLSPSRLTTTRAPRSRRRLHTPFSPTSLATAFLAINLLTDASDFVSRSGGGAGRVSEERGEGYGRQWSWSGSAGRVGVRGVGAAVTVYTAAASATTTADDATYTGLPAYDTTQLTAPALPDPANPTAFDWVIPSGTADLLAQGLELSVTQKGNFLGFSIELSVSNSLMGTTPNAIKPEFLNYMANIQNRAGVGAIVRVGGNSQDDSTLFLDGFPGSADIIQKIQASTTVTATPIVNYSEGLLQLMANVTSQVGVQWFFGLAFNSTDAQDPDANLVLVAETAQSLLGDNLLGLQLGNEPDLYAGNSRRNSSYTLDDYIGEFQYVKTELLTGATLSNDQFLVGPSVCCDTSGFELDDVFGAGWLTQNLDNLARVAVQHYPTNNCQENGVVISAQDIFSDFLNHTSATNLTEPYLNGTVETLAAGKDIVMLETNTASCGGFPGLSDSFGATLWMADYALQMAYRNFTAALMHCGGQNVYYNPFTPPPAADAKIYEWTTGSIYYASLAVAETFGSSGVAQIVDLNPNVGNIYTPGYGIYENGTPQRLVLFNYLTDATGASDYTATISINGAALPNGNVTVRYLQAASTAEKYNITWAGMTMGASFSSDGTLKGNETSVSIACDTTANTCNIPVMAPSMALVFLTDLAVEEVAPPAGATTTFATSVVAYGTATINPSVLATSNGDMGSGNPVGSTSENSAGTSAAERRALAGGVTWLVLGTVGAVCMIWLR